jgi:hypothetical protein
MQVFAWPIAVVIIAFGFMLLFKMQIASFLGRVKEVGSGGIKATTQEPQPPGQEKPTTANDLLSVPNPLIAERETAIDADLKARGPSETAEVVRLLTRQVALLQISLAFEHLDNVIWGSQIDLLRVVNSTPNGLTEADIRPFYDQAAIAYADAYQNYPFENYLRFLLESLLILENAGRYYIAQFGREYLVYLASVGRTGWRPF